ncbi:HNH endonuclease [Kitasatospora sp. NPDC058444]|uniref:HNH endonuclease n=1 Tax=Kitasatospora sp. NPDC058444 TaxID=3346504 RepID=UPI00365F2D34
MSRARHRSGRPYQRARRAMFAIYGTVCHICGHEGAGEADHLTPVSVDPGQPLDPHGMRPAHGANAPCPTCLRLCNTERGARPITKAVRTSRDW